MYKILYDKNCEIYFKDGHPIYYHDGSIAHRLELSIDSLKSNTVFQIDDLLMPIVPDLYGTILNDAIRYYSNYSNHDDVDKAIIQKYKSSNTSFHPNVNCCSISFYNINDRNIHCDVELGYDSIFFFACISGYPRHQTHIEYDDYIDFAQVMRFIDVYLESNNE